MSSVSHDVSFCRTWLSSMSGLAFLGWVRDLANRYRKQQIDASQKRKLNLARIRADLDRIRRETLAMEETMPIASAEQIAPGEGTWDHLQNSEGCNDDDDGGMTDSYSLFDLQRALSFRPDDGEMGTLDAVSTPPWEADARVCATIDDYQRRHYGQFPTILVLGSWVLSQLPESMRERYPYGDIAIPVICPPGMVETAILAFAPSDIPRMHTQFSFLSQQHSHVRGEAHEHIVSDNG